MKATLQQTARNDYFTNETPPHMKDGSKGYRHEMSKRNWEADDKSALPVIPVLFISGPFSEDRFEGHTPLLVYLTQQKAPQLILRFNRNFIPSRQLPWNYVDTSLY